MRTRSVATLLCAALMVTLSGCLFDTTLNEQGGGTMKVELRGGPNDTLEKVKASFTGPGVEITKATMDDKKNAALELAFTDFTKLGALKQFENVTFTLTEDRKAKTRTASAVTKYAKPVTLPEDQLAYFGKDVTIALTVPGNIVKSNGKTDGKTARWTVPLNTLLGAAETPFSVTYAHSGAPLAQPAAPAKK